MATASRAELWLVSGYAKNALGACIFGILHYFLFVVVVVVLTPDNFLCYYGSFVAGLIPGYCFLFLSSGDYLITNISNCSR